MKLIPLFARACLLSFGALFASAAKVRAQAPASLSDTVLSYDLYTPLADHRDTFQKLWLQPSGRFVTLWTDLTRSEEDYGQLNPASGNWTYTQTGPTTGQLVLSLDSEPALPRSLSLSPAGMPVA